MSPVESWKPAYIAVSVLLKEGLEDVITSLGGEQVCEAPDLLRVLRSASQNVRAGAIARIMADAVTGLDRPVAP